MQIEPSAEKFAARYAAGEPQVVWTTLVADLETPVSAFLKIAGSRPMSFLLESVEGGAVRLFLVYRRGPASNISCKHPSGAGHPHATSRTRGIHSAGRTAARRAA